MFKLTKWHMTLIIPAFGIFCLAACAGDNQNHTTAVTTVTPPPHQVLNEVQRPQKIADEMKARGEQDTAEPVIDIVSPANGSEVNGSTVQVRLNLSGDLKGYKPHKDPATQKGNHIHIILDNQPYEAYYELGQPFELRNVVAGKHTLRVFPSRPWHESYKNAGAFQMTTFTVKGGGDAAKPTTTNSGQVMANNNANVSTEPSPKTGSSANANASASPAPSREGKDVSSSQGGDVDPAKPLLTYSRPKGEYKDADADVIMIDFWLTNAKLRGDGGEYRLRYIIDDDDAKYIEKWEPIWLSGWLAGKHTIRLELVDKDGKPVENGGYNTTTREITVVK